MFKFIMGVIIGVVICTYYPSVVPIVKYKFQSQAVLGTVWWKH